MTPARRRTARVSSALAGLVLVLAVSACQQDAGTDEPSPSATATPDATPTPSAEPTTPAPEETPTAAPDDGASAGPAVNGPNSIVSPLDGATVPGPAVTVRGEGTAYEGTLNYEVVVPETDEVVAADFTQAGANGEVGPYEFTVELPPGTYLVRVFEPEISDAEPGDGGAYVNLVEITVTVG